MLIYFIFPLVYQNILLPFLEYLVE